MPKIKLNLETMSVESFETADVSAEQGTVVAHQQRTFNGCGSEVDRCQSSRGCTFIGDCVTQLC